MSPASGTVFIILFVGLFIQVNGLISMRSDVPVNITQQTVSLCPCSLGEQCNTTVTLPMMEASTSQEWYSVSSSALKSLATRALQCGDQELHLTIREGSFALLATGELLHVHAKLILDNSSFCLKRSFSEDYEVEGNQRQQQVMLEAEICMTPPSMSLCCPSGSVISSFSSSNTESNITFSCIPSAVPFLVPPISFDGSTHKWPLEGQVRDFPTCHQTLTIVPVNVGEPGFGYLQLVESRLQFRWQPGATDKFLTVDSSKYCIGQERRYNSLRSVVAVCPSEHKPENYCQNSACFGKCCPDDQIYDLHSTRCVSSSFIFSWMPFREADAGYHVVYGMPSCESFFAISAVDTRDIFRFLGNGSIHIDSWSKAVSVPEYCFDIFQNQTHSEAMALVCFDGSDEKGFKPHDYMEDQSVVLFFLSSVLLISAAHLLISLVCYLGTVRKENTQNTSTNKEAQVCLGLNVFQLLVCVFIHFPAIQIVLVALLQFFHQELNQYFCILIASIAEWAALCSSGYIVALWLQLGLRLQSPRVRLTVLLFVVPALLATTLVIVSIFVIEPERLQTCNINAAFANPWGAWLTTAAHAGLLLVAFAGLTLPLCWRRYAHTSSTPARQHHLCCIGIDAQEEALEVKSSDAKSLQENDVTNDVPTELRLENNRWWLLLKFDCLLLAALLSLLAVWQQDAVAFWAFGDIVLAFKCNVMAACLWMYLCKHCKRI